MTHGLAITVAAQKKVHLPSLAMDMEKMRCTVAAQRKTSHSRKSLALQGVAWPVHPRTHGQSMT
jgi:hypothetical protein